MTQPGYHWGRCPVCLREMVTVIRSGRPLPRCLHCEPVVPMPIPGIEIVKRQEHGPGRSIRITSDHPPTTLSADLYSVHMEGGEPMPAVSGLTWDQIEPLAAAWLAGGAS